MITGGPFVSSVLMEYAQHTMLYLADAIQFCAAILIALAAAQATFRSLVVFFRRASPESATEDVRLRLGRWLVLALEFQVAADILRTAVAPTWDEIRASYRLSASRRGFYARIAFGSEILYSRAALIL